MNYTGSLNGHRFLWVGVRMLVNAASLNARENVGNVTYLQKAPVVYRTEGRYALATDVPVISGNMLRHWLWEGFVRVHDASDLSEEAKRGSSVRYESAEAKNKSEEEMLRSWGDADIFGYLIPDKNMKRTSPLYVSFVLPAEEFVAEHRSKMVKDVTHNRVAEVKGKNEDTAMMVFKREYVSAPYAWAMLLNLWKLGKKEWGEEYVVSEEKVKERVKSLLEGGLAYVLGAMMGANLARAFPSSRVVEAVAVLSDKPLPLHHPYYKDWEQAVKDVEGIDGVKVIKLSEAGNAVKFVEAIEEELGL